MEKVFAADNLNLDKLLKKVQMDERVATESDPMANPSPYYRQSTSQSVYYTYILALFVKVKQGFSSLQGSPPELYKAYLLKFLDSYSYFSLSIIFTLFLSSDFGFSDIEAGTIYGAWGALITIYGLITGVIVDNLGVALSLRFGFLISLVARVALFYTTSKNMLLFHILVTLPMGNCLGIPVLTTGIRRYTDEASRGFAFGLFYVVMNVAALLSGPIVDLLTIWYKEEKEEAENGEIDYSVWTFSSYRAIILTGIGSNLIACFVTLTVREIKVDTHDNAATSSTSVSAYRPTGGTFRQILQETMTAPSFRRFLVVCLITLNVRMIFRHLDATVRNEGVSKERGIVMSSFPSLCFCLFSTHKKLPKYMLREFGENVAKGTIYAINPALIIILVPVFTAATTDQDPLTVIHYGTYVSAISVFCLVLSTSIGACIAFVTLLSIGEAIWSPRLYDYTMSICEEGREGTCSLNQLFLPLLSVGSVAKHPLLSTCSTCYIGTYMALSSAPLFLAKLPVGFLSGYLLSRYCPEEGERQSKTMWLIIGCLTLTSPILLSIFWGYVSKKDPHSNTHSETEIQQTKYSELNATSQIA